MFADELVRTPKQTEGPFYPNKLPLDTDNDLLVINDGITPAVGEVTYLTGRILDAKGDPVRNALVEIWQVDNNGAYIHTKDPARREARQEFPGIRSVSDRFDGRVLFPHDQAGSLHRPDAAHPLQDQARFQRALTTQCYVKGEPANERDGIYRGIRDPKARESVTVDFAPIPGSRIGELAARFDVVLGFTPEG